MFCHHKYYSVVTTLKSMWQLLHGPSLTSLSQRKSLHPSTVSKLSDRWSEQREWSQHSLKLQEPCGDHVVNSSCSKLGQLEEVAQDLVQSGFEYIQGQRLHNFSWYSLPVFSHFHIKSYFISPEIFCVSICVCYLISCHWHHWGVSGFVFFTPSHQIFLYTGKISHDYFEVQCTCIFGLLNCKNICGQGLQFCVRTQKCTHQNLALQQGNHFAVQQLAFGVLVPSNKKGFWKFQPPLYGSWNQKVSSDLP